ncbi:MULTISPECIES: hypothetical protein [unclassified Novosphingobium]|uniref:hypothetical protein n=1 Tax=unclassified Novosphingobium TaxID=2644732 RepID=UPI00086BFD11|nr:MULTISPECIES: hypothetical protein [unclassified Novosphingobium]MBN9146550.1 hypothetical protein [Novosphingobium sp.]MDR6709320.1 hypothetical protein [Novosphingobium sp. 1748]ODU78957.1 MAG: hypothetical protein ABT10_21525 [Novosphingobium sp. SCN 63-17]OJX90889.1 MAG: hypothetical protein BGP00_04655 [Novosphingobium sp. 63-713]
MRLRPFKLRPLNYPAEQWLGMVFLTLTYLTTLIHPAFVPHPFMLGLGVGFALAGAICAMATLIRSRRRPIAMPQDANTTT